MNAGGESADSMKVLVFSSLYPNNMWPNHGVFVKERMVAVARTGLCEIRVMAPVPYFPPFKLGSRWRYSQVVQEEMIEDVPVCHPRYVMIPIIGMAVQGFMMFLSLLPVIRKLARKFPFDVIDAHYVYPDGFAAVLLGLVFKKPVIVSARGSDINLFKTFPIIRQFLRFTLKRADHVVAVSQALKNSMVSLGVSPKTIVVIPNGVDTEKFYPCEKVEAKTHLKLAGKQIVLSVGNLTPNKGFDIVIGAFHRLRKDGDRQKLFLVIVGEGVMKEPLQKLIQTLGIEEHVFLAGGVPHHQLSRWYNAADIFCLASEREGWPNVLLESLSCGTPVVATSVGGIPEIIQSEAIGLLAERTSESLASSIAMGLWKSWDSNILRHCAAEHSWESVAQSVVDLFETVLRNSHGKLA